MSEDQKISVKVEDLLNAIDLVGALMGQVSIPGGKAPAWTTAGEVLHELRTLLIRRQAVAQAEAKAEAEKKAAGDAPQAPTETAPQAPETQPSENSQEAAAPAQP